MSSEWKEYKLGEIGVFEYGKLPDKKHIGQGSYKIFTGYKVTDNYPTFNCNEGDVIVVARGVGGTGDIKLAPCKCFLTNLSIKITLNENVVDREYFYYNFFLNNLRYLDSGSVQSQITISDLKNLILRLPDIKTQKDISLILSTIDNKVSKNNQINQTLEIIAQTLFKSWFVDFDPVKAKIAAKEQGQDQQLAAMVAISGKTPDQIAQLPADKRKELAATADLFPDEMVESELGMIPRGWKVENLSSVTTQIKRGITPKYIEDDGVIVLNQKCIRNHTLNFEFARRHNNKLKSINDSFVEIGDILVNSTGVGTLG